MDWIGMHAPLAPDSAAAEGEPRGVCVAVAATDAWLAHSHSFEASLSDEERVRIGRMRFERGRHALIVAYGLHRAVLAPALGVRPQAVALYRDALGRPRVSGDPVWTSLSHASGWIAVAVGARAPVGVDLEPVARAAAVVEIAETIVHPDERGLLSDTGSAAGRGALLALWVRKEAVLKAAGVGLRVPMGSFAIQPDGSARVPGFQEDWRVRGVDLGPDAPIEVAVAAAGEVAISCSVIEPSHLRDAAIAYASAS